MSIVSNIPGPSADSTHGGVADFTIEKWVRTVHSALPGVEDGASQEDLNDLVIWMAKFTPDIVRRLAGRFHVSRYVVDDILKDLPQIIRVFLTCPASEHTAACPGVTAYIRYAEATVAGGEAPRSFWKWCFFGTRTRLFSYLKQTFRVYGAPAELFRARESGQKARRRLVHNGQLVEYLRLDRQVSGTETWCHRSLHPDGQRPLNAVPSTERRFLSQSQAEEHTKFVLTAEHTERERVLVESLDGTKGIFEVRFLGNASNPVLLLWVFEQLHEPFPLLATTLDAIFTASTRFRNVDPETAHQGEVGVTHLHVLEEDQENDNND